MSLLSPTCYIVSPNLMVLGYFSSAGAETTTASVAAFLIAMIHYPQIMRKAQAQIDAVVGRDRVPTFADRPHLPYIRALVKELLRWRPAGPMGEFASLFRCSEISFRNEGIPRRVDHVSLKFSSN